MFHKLDGICGEIIAKGSVIPFNCLKIRFSGSCDLDDSRQEETCSSEEESASSDDYENVSSDGENFSSDEENFASYDEDSQSDGGASTSDEEYSTSVVNFSTKTGKAMRNLATNYLQLRYLGIYGSDCKYHKPLAPLLKKNHNQLRSLTISNAYPFQRLQTTDWHPRFPRLEDFSIAYTYPEDANASFYLEHESEESQRDILSWLLKDAPNLKRINLAALELLKIVPEDLLTRVDLESSAQIHLTSKKSMEAFVNMPRTRFSLCHIRIFESSSQGWQCSHSYYPPEYDDEPVDLGLRPQFDLEVEQALQNHHQHLQTIEVVGVYPLLSNLSHPPLSKLSKLTISMWEQRLDELWSTIDSINFERAVPRLEEVEIVINYWYPIDGGEDVYNEWPMTNNADIINSSKTVRKLKLDLHVKKINLRPFQTLFPNASILHLHLNGYKFLDRRRDFAPVEEIWECWPQLEELKFFGQNNFLNRNYDSDFCGIHVEEVNLLRQKGSEYLQNVHIVPIKPCLLSMPSTFYSPSLFFK